MFCCEIEIFSSLKNVVANFESVSMLSGYVGMQTRSFCFSKFCLSFDFLSSLPELIIILTSSISAFLISSIKV